MITLPSRPPPRTHAFALPEVRERHCAFALLPPRQRSRAFTLIELLVVIGIVVVVFSLLAPALSGFKNAADVTTAGYVLAGYLEQARNHAMAHNTYVWVGLYEEAAGAGAPTAATPPYPGKGRIVLAAVASSDGTTGCEDSTSTAGSRVPLTATRIHPVGKIIRVENVHMGDIGAPLAASNQDPNSIDGRPGFPYTSGASLGIDYQNRISSDDTHSPFNQTLYPFLAQGYTFYKTIRFSPAGEASINGTYSPRRVAEIGLIPTRGSTLDVNNRNVIAIQFSGMAGNFKIFRR